MNRSRIALAPAFVVAALAPMLMVAPADAATASNGCIVAPVRPAASGQVNANNIPIVNYDIKVVCAGGRSVQVQQFRLEEDTVAREGEGVDDLTGNTLRTLSFAGGASARTERVRAALPKTPGDGAVEEVLHKVRFRVTTAAGTSAWTSFEPSAVRAIHR
jgi:hypothetical protein